MKFRFASNALALLATCWLVFTAVPCAAQGGPAPVILLPGSIAQGGEILASISGQAPGVDRDLELVLPSGGLIGLTTVRTDRDGNALAGAPLPDVPAGPYMVQLVNGATVLGSAVLQVTAAPVISLMPATGVGGELVEVEVSGLAPGRTSIFVDGQLVIGPRVPEGNMLNGRFRVPNGGDAELIVRAESRVGDRLVGAAEVPFQRLRTEQSTVDVVNTSFPAPPHNRHTVRTLSGVLTLPDHLAPEDYRWTLALEPRDGPRIPVNVSDIEFTPVGQKGRSRQYSFNVDMVIPSVLSGFGLIDLEQPMDVEFIVQTPDTGETGQDLSGVVDPSLAALSTPNTAGLVSIGPAVFDLDDDYGIQIEGRVIDENTTNGLADVQVVVIAETPFIEPFQIGAEPLDILANKAPGDQVPAARSNALMFENNQLTAAATQLGILTAAGSSCEKIFRVLKTDGNGSYSFAFSPELTNYLNLMAAEKAKLDRIIYQSAGGGGGFEPPYDDRFKVKINGLLRDPAYGKPSSQFLNSFTAVSYAFERTDSGLYFFCEPGHDGACNDFFDPTQTLESKLEPVPVGVQKIIQTPLEIEGLSPHADDKDTAVWSGLMTFPGQAGNPSLESATTRIALGWDDIALGVPTATVSIDGVGSFPMGQIATQACIEGYAVYAAAVPGLATRSRTITGTIEVESASGTFFRPIRIETVPGPTWFTDPARYQQPVNFVWSPGAISITAFEVPKDQDVSKTINKVGLDTLNNTNGVDAVVTQLITGGQVSELKRIAGGDVTVMNNSGGFAAKTLPLQPGVTAFAEERVISFEPAFEKIGKQDLLDRLEDPTFGSKRNQVLLGGAFIPIARYAWGAPPIVGALFGIDLLYLVQLLNFGYVEVTTASISVDSITEPQSFIGLSIFFDLSLFIVSGSISAEPTIGVGMPLVIVNSVLNAQESQPCFEFELPLKFKIGVGPCPFCISASFTTVPVDFQEPSQCTVGAGKRLAKGLSDAPTPDGLALATNGAGQSMALIVDDTGIKAQNILAGIPDSFEQLTSGRGAIKPDTAWYQQNAAVAVWAQTSLSDADFDQRMAADYDCTRADTSMNPDCDDHEAFDAHQFQHLWYATYDGQSWSLPAALTAPNTGEGNVRLASCPQSDPACPPGGEVFAVWQRMSGELADRDLKLYYAFFDGMAWTTPTALDGSPGAHQQPAPVYLDGEPVVFWIHNSTPLNPDLSLRFDSRQLVYQFPRESAGTQVAPGFPGWVASPDAAAGAGIIHLVYTANAPEDPFFGTRRALHSATVEDCAAGVCSTFSTQKQQDLYGRDIFVEAPQVDLNGAGVPTAHYRWVGTGGQAVAKDPFGTVGTGDTAMSVIIAGQPTSEVLPITNDGQVNWQTQAVYDPAISSFLTVSVQVPELTFQKSIVKSGVNRQPLGSVRRHKLAGTAPVTLFEVPDLPDLTIADARIVGSSVVQGDDVVTLRAVVANQGQPLIGSTSVEAWLDGPPGVGVLLGGAGGIFVTDPAGTLVEFTVDVPSGVLADERHRLELIVNAAADIEESRGDNNAFYLPLNALPVPGNVSGFADLVGTTAFLEWDDPEDMRVTAYRVYRRDLGSDSVMQAGVSPLPGFVDVMAVAGQSYQYCVAALSDRLMESDCSPWVGVAVKAMPGPVLFRNGFE